MATEPFDPNDIESVRRHLAQLESQHAAAASTGTVNTGGGTAVHGSVRTQGGHFIGRDFVQIIQQVLPGEDQAEAQSVIASYLHALALDLSGVKLAEIDQGTDQSQQTPLQLADIYVPLDTTLSVPEKLSLAQWLAPARQRQREQAPPDERQQRPVSALEALAQHPRLTLLGQPGSGKSTFGAHVLLTLAQAWQSDANGLASLGPTWTHGKLLPVRVVLRDFAAGVAANDGRRLRAGDLWEFIGAELTGSGLGLSGDVMCYVQRIARQHGALLLLDGLDECGEPARRARVLGAVDELVRGAAGTPCRFLLTARPYAWPAPKANTACDDNAKADPSQGVYALAELTDAQIEQFIERWYAALQARGWRTPAEVQAKGSDLQQAYQRPDLLPLARNPLLLTLTAVLHSNQGGLPDDRADLYDSSVDLMLLRWNRQIGADKALLAELAVPGLTLAHLREVLERLALQVHGENVGRQGTADIGEDRLVRAFKPLLGSKDKADQVVEFIERRAGLLIGRGQADGGAERQFTFPHRTFQEFLAACALAARDDFATECARLARAAPGHWEVVLPLAARQAKAERGASAADALIGRRSVADIRRSNGCAPGPADWICARLAAQQLVEIGIGQVQADEGRRAIVERVQGWLVESLPLHPTAGGADAAERARAGDMLSALGDPRFDPQRWHLPADPMLGFVRVEADPQFCIGTRQRDRQRVADAIGREAYDNEINDDPTPAPAFFIARYPVTVAQFRAFMDATGSQPEYADALRDPDNRPVRYVSWDEATAYCGWLQAQLAGSSLADGCEPARWIRDQRWQVTLPSELEWEKAARGGLEAAVFPWGDGFDRERANAGETGIGTTTSVGCFPANGWQLHDTAGNVWEWTRSPWRKSYQDEMESDVPGKYVERVVRGGAWYLTRDFARCASRFGGRPDLRHGSLGFRVVLCSSPV